MKILAIDDNPDNLTALEAVVQDALPDSKLLTALNGLRGLELALAEDPDVILLDIVMPGMDGYEVCRRLKADERLRPIPVVFLTALRTDSESRIRALESGAEAFLSKPIDAIELTAQIRAMQKIKAASTRERAEKENLTDLLAAQTRELELAHADALNLLEDLKKENTARQEREAHLRLLFENLPSGVVVHAADTAVFFANPEALRLLGLTLEQMQGKTATDPAWCFLREDGGALPLEDYPVNRLRASGKPFAGQVIGIRLPGRAEPNWVQCSAFPQLDASGQISQVIVAFTDITARKQAGEALKRIEWLLTSRPKVSDEDEQACIPPYGNLVALNTCRLILDSVGEQTLADIVRDYLRLLDTSSAVYEKNGDYALGIFSSGWCRTLDAASRRACGTNDNRTALACGQWHCHESCWSRASKTAIETGQPTDIECDGGIRLYAVPIRVGDEIIGAINIGYGDPPRDEEKLRELASRYQVSHEELRALSMGYESRPAFITDLAKDRLQASARLIGVIIERKQAEEILRESEERFKAISNYAVSWESWFGPEGKYIWVNPAVEHFTGYSAQEILALPDFVSTVIADEDRAVFIGRFQEAIHGSREDNFEFRYLHKNGTKHWLSASWQPIYDAQGNPLGTRSSGYDITERKQAEEQIHVLLKESEKSRCALFGILEEQKRAEENLRALSSRQEAILSAIPDIIMEVNCNKVYRWANQPGFDFFGEDVIGKEAAFYFAGDAPVYSTVQPLFDGDENVIRVASWQRRKDGEKRLLDWSCRVLKDLQGHVTGALSTAHDITDRVRLAEALEKRLLALTSPLDQTDGITFEDLFELDDLQRIQDEFAAATGVASVITRPDGTPLTRPSNFTRLCKDIIRSTETGCRNCLRSDALLGTPHPGGPVIQPCLSSGLWDAGASICVGDRHIANWLIGQVRDETQSEDKMREYARTIGADEAAFIEAFREVPVLSIERFRQIAQALFSLAKQLSVTAYQNIQQARFISECKRTETALRESESRFAQLAAQSRTLAWEVDAKGLYTYVSDMTEDVTGYRPVELVGRMHFYDLHPETGREAFRQAAFAVFERKEPLRNLVNAIQRKDGPTVWIATNGDPVLNADGTLWGYRGSDTDITERKRTEAELQKLDKLQSVGTLAGGIAHDFNNVLLGLFGNISIAMDDLPKDHPSYAPLEEAEKSMTRAVRLTKQLLTFATGGDPVKEYVSMGAMAEEVARFDLTGSNVSLVCHTADNLWPVDADRGQLQQVISNLVINARQSMPSGGHLHVTLENADLPAEAIPGLSAGRYVKVIVQDEGGGIEPKVIGQIFDPYFTTKQTGNGLGLATVWSIIIKHGGHIGVESELGKGTTFTFFLPASASPLPAAAKPPAAESPATTCPAKILVMDDEDSVSRLVVRMLTPCGHIVTTAADGQETIALYRQALEAGYPFDAVIMDLTIPGGPGGKEVIQDLLAFDPYVLALVSSGYAADPVMANPGAYGFKGVVAKPYTSAALREAVARVLA